MFTREKFQGKKTYIFGVLVILHSMLDWFELAPAEGAWDAGSTQAVAQAGLSMMGMTIRMAVSRWMIRIEAQQARIEQMVAALHRRAEDGGN